MVEDHKKSESEHESVKMNDIMDARDWIALALERISTLDRRVKALEKAMIDVKHTNTDDGSRHRNDGGWFD